MPFVYAALYRDVSTGATGIAVVAPKFSDTLTLYQKGPAGGMGRFCSPKQKSQLNFPNGYVPPAEVCCRLESLP